MRPATSRRLQAYLTGLATTTGLVASSGAAIVTIDITDISGPNAGLAADAFSFNFGMVPGLPDLAFYAMNGRNGMYGFAVQNRSNVGDPAGFEAAAYLDAHPKNFGFGESIGTSMNITAGVGHMAATLFKVASLLYSNSSPAFEAGSYLGFTDGQDHYGWLEVTWNGTDTFEVLSGAYESEAGVSIGAGLTAIPEPGNLLALSGLVGSAMFLRSRRRKNVA